MKNIATTFTSLPITKLKIDEGPFSPLDQESFDQLKDSIKQYGIIYPLVVTKDYQEEDKYLVLDGRNRYRALLALKQKEVPCFIVDIDFPQAYIVSYETELFRRHLSKEEKSDAFKRRTDLEKELVREYKRRIIDNVEGNEQIKNFVLKINDLSVLIELYYISEKISKVSGELKDQVLSQILSRAKKSSGYSERSLEKEEELEKIKEERDRLKFRVEELQRNIKILLKEKETIEKNFKKIATEIEEKIRKQITAELVKSSDQTERIVMEYKRIMAEKLAKEEANTRMKIRSLTKDIDNLKNELEKAKTKIKELEEERKRIMNERDSLKLTLNGIKNDIYVISIDPFIAEIDLLKKKMESLRKYLNRILEHKKALSDEAILLICNSFEDLRKEYSLLCEAFKLIDCR